MAPFEAQLRKWLDSDRPDKARFEVALALLAKRRTYQLQSDLIRTYGTDVQSGPFRGMHFVDESAEGCHIPKLLGCYEQELHEFVLSIPGRRYDTILNIGCAEGYYAVGFKRLCPATAVVACDTNPEAQTACRTLAERNGVALDIRGEFTPADFAGWPGRTLVWCDIEGAERELLDPDKAPALAGMDIVVELHPMAGRANLDIVPKRFEVTHDVTVFWPRVGRPDLPVMFRPLSHMDQLLAIWEWRSTPTPWAVLLARSAGASTTS